MTHAGVTRLITRPQLDAALPEVDIIVLACPLTDETEGMIGAAQIALMKPDAIVINVARGPLIDQPALTAALSAGRLAGAASTCSPPSRCRPTIRSGRSTT